MIKADSAGRADLQLQLLVLRCQAGDENAFAQLFDRFAPRTLAHLRSFVGDDAEDVQQEVWLAVYRSLRGLSNPGALRTWLFRTTRHRAIDFLRRRKREVELIEETTIATETKEPADDDFGSIDDDVLNEVLAELVHVCFQQHFVQEDSCAH